MPRKKAPEALNIIAIMNPSNNYALRFAALASLQKDKEAVLLRRTEINQLVDGIEQLKALCETLLKDINGSTKGASLNPEGKA